MQNFLPSEWALVSSLLATFTTRMASEMASEMISEMIEFNQLTCHFAVNKKDREKRPLFF